MQKLRITVGGRSLLVAERGCGTLNRTLLVNSTPWPNFCFDFEFSFQLSQTCFSLLEGGIESLAGFDARVRRPTA